MRYIVVLMLVLWAGTGWAGSSSALSEDDIATGFRTSIMVDGKELRKLLDSGTHLNVFVYEYDENRDMWDRARPNQCLERMEAAMKAMEPFLPDGKSNIMTINQDGNYELAKGGYWVGYPEHEVQALRDALAEWKSVRRDCWR